MIFRAWHMDPIEGTYSTSLKSQLSGVRLRAYIVALCVTPFCSKKNLDTSLTVMANWSQNIWNLLLQPLKTNLHYQSAYGHQTWQDSNSPRWVPAHKVTYTLIKWQTKIITSPLPQCLWLPNLAGCWPTLEVS